MELQKPKSLIQREHHFPRKNVTFKLCGNEKGLGWVTLATNDSYAIGALVLGHSLTMTNTIADLIVLVTPGVTDIMREKLQLIYRLVAEVDVLDSKDESNLKMLKRPELGVTFTKLHCWRLTQYKKCVFLDADTLVLSNCDELFDREEFSAAPDVGWPDCFNSGVFVFQPSTQTYETLITFALEHGSFDGGDQGLLNLYFNRWAHDDIRKHLPFVYNMCSVASYSYLPAFKQYGGNVKIVHFIGGTKPWLQTFNTETKLVQPAAGMKHLQDFLQTWWNIFCNKVHGSLTLNMFEENIPDRCTANRRPSHINSTSSNSSYCSPISPHSPPVSPAIVDPCPAVPEVCDPWLDYVEESSFVVEPIESHYITEENNNVKLSTGCNFDTNVDTNIDTNIDVNVDKNVDEIIVESINCADILLESSNTRIDDCVDCVDTNYVETLSKSSSSYPNPIETSTNSSVHPTNCEPNDPSQNENEPSSFPPPINECNDGQKATDSHFASGLANAFAQFTLGAPRTDSQLALEDHLRKQNWEVGNIDYLGRDSFDNIWTKITATVAATSGTKETVAVPHSVVPSVVSTAEIISPAVKSNVVESNQTSVALKDILTPQTEKPVDTVVALPKPIDLPREVISDSTQNTAPPPLTLPTYAAVANSEPPPKPVVESAAVTATVSAPATSVSGSSPAVQQIKPEVVVAAAAKPPPEEKKVVEVVALTAQPEVKQVEPAVIPPTPVEKIVSVLYKTEGIIEATQSTEGLLPITIADISAAAPPAPEELPVIVSAAAVVKNVASAPAALPTQLQEIPAPVAEAPKAAETAKVDDVKAAPVKVDEVKAAPVKVDEVKAAGPVKIEEVKVKLEEVPVKVEEVKVVVLEPAKVVEEQKPVVNVEEKAKTQLPVVVPVVEQAAAVEKNGNNKKGKNGKQDKNGKAQEAKDKSAKLADKPQEKGAKAEAAKDDKSGKDEKAANKPDSPPCEIPQECAKQEKCAAKQDKCAKPQECPKECAKPQDKSAKKQDCPKQQEKAAKQDKCPKQGKTKSPDRSKGKGTAKTDKPADKSAEKVESDTKVPIVAEDAKLVKEQTAIAKSAEVIVVAAAKPSEESPKPEKKISPVLGKKSSKPDAPPKQGKQKTEPVPKKDNNGKTTTAPQPKVDTSKTDQAKGEPAKTETPKTETPKTEAPKTETAKTTTNKSEAAKPVDASKATEATIPAALPAAVQAAPATVESASADKSAQAAAAKSGKKESTAAPTPPPRKSNNGGGGGKKGKSKK